jgi:hypothetical protein
MDREPDDLDALLARGRLGGPERERIAKRVVGETARKRRVWPALVAGTSALAAAAALLLVLGGPSDGLRPKGSEASAALDVVCTIGDLHRCPRGGTLAFSIEGATEPTFVHAWAEQAGHERVWYFAGGDAVRTDPQRRVLERGVVVDADPGMLRVHVVVARKQLSRETLLRPEANAEVVHAAIVEIEVTP